MNYIWSRTRDAWFQWSETLKKHQTDLPNSDLAWDGKPPTNPYPSDDPRHEAWFYGLDPSTSQPELRPAQVRCAEVLAERASRTKSPSAMFGEVVDSLDDLCDPDDPEDPDWREMLQDRQLTDTPCVFLLLKQGLYFIEPSLESLKEKFSRMRGVPSHAKKEDYLFLACLCHQMPKQTIPEVMESFEAAYKANCDARNRYMRNWDYAKRDYLLEVFNEFFHGIRREDIADSIELPRRPPKYSEEPETGLDSVLAHTPLTPNVCDGCGQRIPDCRCHLYRGDRRV